MGCMTSKGRYESVTFGPHRSKLKENGSKVGQEATKKFYTDPNGESYSRSTSGTSGDMERIEVCFEDSALAAEISRREKSAVHTNVALFEQRHARASLTPALRKITTVEKRPGSITEVQVSKFEELEAAARRAPRLGAVNSTALETGRVSEKMWRFEDVERERTVRGSPFRRVHVLDGEIAAQAEHNGLSAGC